MAEPRKFEMVPTNSLWSNSAVICIQSIHGLTEPHRWGRSDQRRWISMMSRSQCDADFYNTIKVLIRMPDEGDWGQCMIKVSLKTEDSQLDNKNRSTDYESIWKLSRMLLKQRQHHLNSYQASLLMTTRADGQDEPFLENLLLRPFGWSPTPSSP